MYFSSILLCEVLLKQGKPLMPINVVGFSEEKENYGKLRVHYFSSDDVVIGNN